jgi:hypothetical protein
MTDHTLTTLKLLTTVHADQLLGVACDRSKEKDHEEEANLAFAVIYPGVGTFGL